MTNVSYWRYVGSGYSPYEFGKIYVWGAYEMQGAKGWQQVTRREYEEEQAKLLQPNINKTIADLVKRVEELERKVNGDGK